MSYAIFRSGGKQFKAEKGRTIRVPLLEAEPGAAVTFDEVLLAHSGNKVLTGSPLLEGAAVEAEVVAHGRDKKIVVFKHKRRKDYRRKTGHRQDFTEVRIKALKVR
jgi:large subunit ribosomal protein L21